MKKRNIVSIILISFVAFGALSASFSFLSSKNNGTTYCPVDERVLINENKELFNNSFSHLKALNDSEVDAVIAKIDAIEEVTYTEDCKQRIDDARAAYNALTTEQKELVPTEKLSILINSENAYNYLKENYDATDIVIDFINNIGEVTFTHECKTRI